MTSERRWGFKHVNLLVEEKVPPQSFIMLRDEVIHHPDIMKHMAESKNFEECIANIAADCNILLDGDYEAEALFAMLYQAVKNRNKNSSSPESNAPGLVRAEIRETSNSFIIEEVGRDEPITIAKSNDGPTKATEETFRYTVCDTCKTSYECITNRSCGQGKAVEQRDIVV